MAEATLHDCATAACEGAALRAHRERITQGLEPIAGAESGEQYARTAALILKTQRAASGAVASEVSAGLGRGTAPHGGHTDKADSHG